MKGMTPPQDENHPPLQGSTRNKTPVQVPTSPMCSARKKRKSNSLRKGLSARKGNRAEPEAKENVIEVQPGPFGGGSTPCSGELDSPRKQDTTIPTKDVNSVVGASLPAFKRLPPSPIRKEPIADGDEAREKLSEENEQGSHVAATQTHDHQKVISSIKESRAESLHKSKVDLQKSVFSADLSPTTSSISLPRKSEDSKLCPPSSPTRNRIPEGRVRSRVKVLEAQDRSRSMIDTPDSTGKNQKGSENDNQDAEVKKMKNNTSTAGASTDTESKEVSDLSWSSPTWRFRYLSKSLVSFREITALQLKYATSMNVVDKFKEELAAAKSECAQQRVMHDNAVADWERESSEKDAAMQQALVTSEAALKAASASAIVVSEVAHRTRERGDMQVAELEATLQGAQNATEALECDLQRSEERILYLETRLCSANAETQDLRDRLDKAQRKCRLSAEQALQLAQENDTKTPKTKDATTATAQEEDDEKCINSKNGSIVCAVCRPALPEEDKQLLSVPIAFEKSHFREFSRALLSPIRSRTSAAVASDTGIDKILTGSKPKLWRRCFFLCIWFLGATFVIAVRHHLHTTKPLILRRPAPQQQQDSSESSLAHRLGGANVVPERHENDPIDKTNLQFTSWAACGSIGEELASVTAANKELIGKNLSYANSRRAVELVQEATIAKQVTEKGQLMMELEKARKILSEREKELEFARNEVEAYQSRRALDESSAAMDKYMLERRLEASEAARQEQVKRFEMQEAALRSLHQETQQATHRVHQAVADRNAALLAAAAATKEADSMARGKDALARMILRYKQREHQAEEKGLRRHKEEETATAATKDEIVVGGHTVIIGSVKILGLANEAAAEPSTEAALQTPVTTGMSVKKALRPFRGIRRVFTGVIKALRAPAVFLSMMPALFVLALL